MLDVTELRIKGCIVFVIPWCLRKVIGRFQIKFGEH